MMERTEASSAQQRPIVIWGTFPFGRDSPDHMKELLIKEGLGGKLTVVPFYVDDWDADFSPWAAPAFEGQKAFEGRGPKTLEWLQGHFIPELRQHYGAERPLWIMGYSLAGLFALWAAYETDLFETAICCSGSLWFDGWSAYAKTHRMQHPCSVYLSLGGKEAETSNPVLQTVADCTRAQAQLLKTDPRIKHCTLEWNKGGHFADSEKRLVKGLLWAFDAHKKEHE